MNSQCPACGAHVDDELVEGDDSGESATCPECGVSSPLDDWMD